MNDGNILSTLTIILRWITILNICKETIRTGAKRQEPLNPRKYRYVKYFDDLANDNNHIVAIVLFKLNVDEKGNTIENNFVLTAYQKYIRHRR